jgi:hypothetical protein
MHHGMIVHRMPTGINADASSKSDGLPPREASAASAAYLKRRYRVRLNGANHQWGKDPPKEVVG